MPDGNLHDTEPTVPSFLWSPCCQIVRAEPCSPGTVHSGLCRSKHNGVLGPTIRLVPDPEGLRDYRTYRTYQRTPR